MFSIIAIVLIAIVAILIISIPIIIGVFVYKDAEARKMNPILWTIIAIACPGFVGLIIYLVVRNDHSPMSCPQCGTQVNESFAVCPSCGRQLKSTCPTCGTYINPGWNICPNCSTPVPDDIRITKPAKPKGTKSMRLILALVIIIPILLCAVLIILILGFSASSDSLEASVHSEALKSEIIIDGETFDDWCKENKMKDNDVYVIKAFNGSTDGNGNLSILFYSGSQSPALNVEYNYSRMSMGKPKVNIEMYGESESNNSYFMYFSEFTYTEDADLKIKASDNFDVIEVQVSSIEYTPVDLNIDVNIMENASDIYSVTLESRDDANKVVYSETCTAIDDDYFYGGTASFPLTLLNFSEDDIDKVVITIRDKNHSILATSDKITFNSFKNNSYTLYAGLDKDGKYVISEDELPKPSSESSSNTNIEATSKVA